MAKHPAAETAPRAEGVTLLLWPDSLDGGFLARAFPLAGCLAQGESAPEALHALVDAYVGIRTAQGWAPVNRAGESLRHYVEGTGPHFLDVRIVEDRARGGLYVGEMTFVPAVSRVVAATVRQVLHGLVDAYHAAHVTGTAPEALAYQALLAKGELPARQERSRAPVPAAALPEPGRSASRR